MNVSVFSTITNTLPESFECTDRLFGQSASNHTFCVLCSQPLGRLEVWRLKVSAGFQYALVQVNHLRRKYVLHVGILEMYTAAAARSSSCWSQLFGSIKSLKMHCKTFRTPGTLQVERPVSSSHAGSISCTSRYQMSVHHGTQYEDFYRYTGGRWLWGEEKELRDRYKVFNKPELQRITAESVDAESCSAMTKMLEGSFNKVFRLVMSNGATAIARIPYRNIWPKFYTTASEVATMEFVYRFTTNFW